MKTLKNILIGFLVLVLVCLINLLVLSLNFQKVLIDGVIKESIRTKLTPSDITENVNIDNKEMEKLLNSKETDELVNKYLDKILNGVTGEETINEKEFKEDIINYIKNNKEEISKISGQEITDVDINKIEKEIYTKDFSNIINESQNQTNKMIPTEIKTAIKGYQFFTSKKFQIIMILSILIDLILIALLQKSLYKWIKTLSKSMISSGILTIIMSLVVVVIIKFLSPLKTFRINSLLISGIVILITGIIMLIVYNIVVKKEEKVNEVSQIS